MAKRMFRAIPRFWTGQEEMNRRIVGKCLDELQVGKTNNTYMVTLAVDPATTTVFESDRLTPDSEIFWVAKTLHAGLVPILYIEVSTGTATIFHDASGFTDRTFALLIVG